MLTRSLNGTLDSEDTDGEGSPKKAAKKKVKKIQTDSEKDSEDLLL